MINMVLPLPLPFVFRKLCTCQLKWSTETTLFWVIFKFIQKLIIVIFSSVKCRSAFIIFIHFIEIVHFCQILQSDSKYGGQLKQRNMDQKPRKKLQDDKSAVPNNFFFFK